MSDVYVSQIDFGDGILRSFKGEGGGGITDFVDVPTVEETSFGYDGIEKELVFENLDATKVTVGGTTSATAAGTYYCTLTLKSEQYYWKDLTNTTKTITWTIAYSIFGVEWDGTATTAWTRTDDSIAFEDPNPYYAGMTTTPSSPFDNIMPWAGMTVEERIGGTMVKIPKFWYKLTQNANAIKVQISNIVKDGFNVSPAHMDRGDGTGERDVVYIGRYHCSSDDYRSKTGTTHKHSVSRSTARTNIHNLDTHIWQTDFAMRFTLWLLYIVEFADWGSQKKIGKGCTGDNSSIIAMGYTDSMPYHTGIIQSSRTDYGVGPQYRNIEGIWDNIYDFCDGCYSNSGEIYIILNPSGFSDSTGGFGLGNSSINGLPISFTLKNVTGTFPLFIPTATSNETYPSYDTYMCDKWFLTTSGGSIIRTGGNYDYSDVLSNGLFHLSINGVNETSYRYGCRLMELP